MGGVESNMGCECGGDELDMFLEERPRLDVLRVDFEGLSSEGLLNIAAVFQKFLDGLGSDFPVSITAMDVENMGIDNEVFLRVVDTLFCKFDSGSGLYVDLSVLNVAKELIGAFIRFMVLLADKAAKRDGVADLRLVSFGFSELHYLIFLEHLAVEAEQLGAFKDDFMSIAGALPSDGGEFFSDFIHEFFGHMGRPKVKHLVDWLGMELNDEGNKMVVKSDNVDFVRDSLKALVRYLEAEHFGIMAYNIACEE